MDLIRQEPVGLAVARLKRLFARRLGQAEHAARGFVVPVSHEPHPVLVLNREISGVPLPDGLRRQSFHFVVHIHIERHVTMAPFSPTLRRSPVPMSWPAPRPRPPRSPFQAAPAGPVPGCDRAGPAPSPVSARRALSGAWPRRRPGGARAPGETAPRPGPRTPPARE